MKALKCPKCNSESVTEFECFDCDGSGLDEFGEECMSCEGSGNDDGQYMCYDCGHEWEEE